MREPRRRRHKFPSSEEIQTHATPLSELSWSNAVKHDRLLPKESDTVIHVGEGVFLSRCFICGEVFLTPGASPRPPELVEHLFDEHNLYDGYERPIFLIDGSVY